MKATADPLSALGMWDAWQNDVRAALPAFAANPWYLEQNSLSLTEVVDVVAGLQHFEDLDGRTRDVTHGARAFPTPMGDVTRAWVDGNVEIGFLKRHLDRSLSTLDVLDIGAGYGRLAVMLAPQVHAYTCVDAVDVSVEVCRMYTGHYAPTVEVLDVAGLRVAIDCRAIRPTLAINIHSWNECSAAQVAGWLDVLDALAVPFLFTVSHGQNRGAYPGEITASGLPIERSYMTWDGKWFKPSLEARYALVAEESIGITRHPHALWVRR